MTDYKNTIPHSRMSTHRSINDKCGTQIERFTAYHFVEQLRMNSVHECVWSIRIKTVIEE